MNVVRNLLDWAMLSFKCAAEGVQYPPSTSELSLWMNFLERDYRERLNIEHALLDCQSFKCGVSTYQSATPRGCLCLATYQR